MVDDLKPRYTTKRLRQEIERARENDARHIAALEAQLAERAKVKPLEWTELSTGWIAHTSFHAYEVVKTDHGFMATYANMDFAWGAEDAMKTAAQADFERRILFALEAAPSALKVTEAMVERTAKKLLLVMPELLRLYPSTAGEVARRDVREVLDAALTAAQEAGEP